MFGDWHIGVVVPAKNEEKHIGKVLEDMPAIVDNVVVVDDGSSDNTAKLAASAEIVTLDGQGVGAAIDAGHRKMLEIMERPFISVVMAGDGQMDPNDMEKLLQPIIDGKSHHVKGERFDRNKKMPFIRKIGTMILGFLTTLACGQKIRDPQCGYTATSFEVLEEWNWNKSWKGYGYPNWWLMNLTMEGYHIADAPVKAIYDGQKSGLKIIPFFAKVSVMLLIGLHYRLFKWIPGVIMAHPIPIGIIMLYAFGWIGIIYSIQYNPLMLIGVLICWWACHRLDRILVEVMRRPLS